MKPLRIGFGIRAAALYHGKRKMNGERTEMLPDIWRVLEQIRTGKVQPRIAPGELTIFQRVIRDETVYFAFHRPARGEKGVDLLLLDIWWPDDLN